MPSPVGAAGAVRATGPAIKPMANAKMIDAWTAIVTWPVDVWFCGSRTFQATLDFGGRAITGITLDPGCRFPDHDPATTCWPRAAASAAPSGGGRGGGRGGGGCSYRTQLESSGRSCGGRRVRRS